MRSKVFLSCGQRLSEKQVAAKIGKLLEERGFDVYIAIDVQTILEINTGIIRELKNSDCYLFVNFCREQIGSEYRGSLFSNQELAIAYALGFERILVINQEGIRREGMLGYIGVNTETFIDFDHCCAVVGRALDRAKWTTDYTRRLSAGRLRFSDEIIGYGYLSGRFLYLDILNGRPDIAALEATARLSEFGRAGQLLQPSPIRSPLKATARPGFAHTIFPKSYEAFDLLAVGTYGQQSEPGVFLNTAYDVAAAPRLPISAGVWRLRYEFFAIDFPVLSVLIDLTLTDWNDPRATILTQDIPVLAI
jgi:hypothetical protein